MSRPIRHLPSESAADFAEPSCAVCAGYDREHDAGCSEHPEYDPTPWCTGCGALEKKQCDCGERAEND